MFAPFQGHSNQLTWKRANPKFYEGNILSSSLLISPEEYPSRKKTASTVSPSASISVHCFEEFPDQQSNAERLAIALVAALLYGLTCFQNYSPRIG